MARVLFVHGMRHERFSRREIEQAWFDAFRGALEPARPLPGRREALSELELELVFWGDLFAEPEPEYPLQGLGESVEDLVYKLVRESILLVDRFTEYDPFARPSSVVARIIDRQVRQTAMYMANLPTLRLEDGAESTVYDQIQHRFRQALERRPDIVIGHSLGSVIAYEGLCQSPHKVSTLLTVGSPIGVRKLIYDRLRPAEAEPRSAPNVGDWINVSNLADAMVVPVPRISELFRGPVSDVVIRHGDLGLRSLTKNHRFVEYLRNATVRDVLRDALERAVERRAR